MNPTTTPEAGAVADVAAIAEQQAGLRNLYLLQTDNARMAKALRAYVDAYDAGTGTVYVNRQIREALGIAVRQHLEQGATAS